MTCIRLVRRATLLALGIAAVAVAAPGGPEQEATAKGGDRPATCQGRQITIYGTAGNDFDEGSIIGTPRGDVIFGGRGKDYIEGRGGHDVICGDLGTDLILGGPGKDRLAGGPKEDVLAGGAGNDRLYAGPGDDQMDGERGFDRCAGGPGDDVANRRGCEKATSTTFVLRPAP